MNQKPCLLSWFSTIPRHWLDILRYHGQFLKFALFGDFRDENYNRTTTKRKTITFLKLESNLFNANREKKIQFRAKIGRGRSRVLVYKQRWNFFVSKWSRIFPNFCLNLDFQDYENETPKKRILKNNRWGVREEYWRTILLTVHAPYDWNAWLITVTEKITPGFSTNLGTVNT